MKASNKRVSLGWVGLLVACTAGWVSDAAGGGLFSAFTGEELMHDVRNDRLLSEQEFSFSLENADYVLLGELYGEADHHRLQQRVLQMLLTAGRKPAVVFKMFDREHAGLIATTRRRYLKEPDRIAVATE